MKKENITFCYAKLYLINLQSDEYNLFDLREIIKLWSETHRKNKKINKKILNYDFDNTLSLFKYLHSFVVYLDFKKKSFVFFPLIKNQLYRKIFSIKSKKIIGHK